MHWNDLKLGTRLTLGFALVILAGLSVAVLGRIQLGQLGTETEQLINDRMVKYDQLNMVQDNINVVARSVRNVVLLEDEKDMRPEIERINKAREANSAILKALEAKLNTDKGRVLFQRIEAARGPYNNAIDKAIVLGQANQNDAARDMLLKEGRPLQATYFSALGEFKSFQKELMTQSAQRTQAIVATTGTAMVVVAMLAAVLGAAVAWLITRSLMRQLGGEPAYAAQVAREIAAGNLAVDVQLRPNDRDSLLAGMGAMRDSLAGVVDSVRHSSESVAAASAQIAQGNLDLSGRTETQASSLEETAASMEQLSATVKQNADSALQANQLAVSASVVAKQGGQVVDQVVDTMKGINESSRKIGDIISVIDGIAFQTNILALNAAVEAARAGEQGRGFAVVATEVRSLAGRSAEAAKQIKALIGDSVERVAQGTALVDQAGATMTEVVASIGRVTHIMGEISSASHEQAAGVAQVGEAVAQMDEVTQQNAALVEEMAAAAGSMRSQADDLVQAVAIFKLAQDRGMDKRAAAPVRIAAAARPPVRIKAALRRPAATPRPA
jgi:methyl-accepting chemotaxis protein